MLNDFFITTGTSETLKGKNQKKIDKQKGNVQLKLANFCHHPVSLEPEVTGA